MQTQVAVYLEPRNGYRNALRSDSLWGLLCWGIRYLYGEKELERFINKAVKKDPEFIISSAFPFSIIGEKKHHFFPKPFLPPLQKKDLENDFPDAGGRFLKKYFKLRWLHQSDYTKVIKGEWSERELVQHLLKEKLQHKIVPKKQMVNYTHNTIDRIKGSTLQLNEKGQLYHTDAIYWKFDTTDISDKTPVQNIRTGIYFLVKGDQLDKLYPVLRYFEHQGIGGDHSIGKGLFKISYDHNFKLDEPVFKPTDDYAFTNLSLFYPKQADLDMIDIRHPMCRYLIDTRSGRVGVYTKRINKPGTLFFREGSVFPSKQEIRNFYGKVFEQKITNSQLPHPIYANGMAWPVKIKIKS